MNWKKLAGELIPVAAAATGNTEIEGAAKVLEGAINAHVANQVAVSGKTRDDILTEAQTDWNQDVDEADKFLKEGHEQA